MHFYIPSLLALLALPTTLAAQHLQYTATPTQVTTLAGSATGKSKEPIDGDGAAARFKWPMGIAAAADGVVYVTDEEANTIRKITPSGTVTTLAGSAAAKGSADGTGGAARFYHPVGLAVAKNGDLYVADADNHTIRKITPAGIVTTVAGTAGQQGPAGQVTTWAGVAGSKGSADGPGAQARFLRPAGIAVDAAGVVYIADNGNHTVRKISPEGLVTTLAGVAGKKGSVDGTGPEARFDVPNGIAVGSDGRVYIADYLNSVIRQIAPQGAVATLAGHLKGWRSLDGPGAEARFSFPFGVAVGSNGWIYVADSGNHTIRIIK
ncbi:MAG: hypothetical protein EOO57_12805 [Hymenobacter sp.]|nr:MAG: hypothetical protein EOO57_12805 [Hymenobacter sp.]